ncbi:MAG: site-specific DNA-methyltransferase, partial [Deferribacteraceae bacterium]|nr:site-specific DNA-methyltransferase [Deferribacteraceae bacterium]
MGEQTSPLGTAAIGDNLDYLRLLYEEQMFFDMIYIDPPYNTGNKFSYHDKREDWVDFISKRLKLAKAVLKDDGVIFISIDDSCLYELKVEADGIFSKSNFLGAFITMQAVRSNSRHINTVHEYIIGYAKDKKRLGGFKIRRVNNPDDAAMIKDISDKVRREFILFGRETAKKLLAKLNSDYMLKRGISWLRNYSEVDDEGEIFFPKDLSVPGAPNELIIQEIDLRLPMLKSRKWSTPKKFIKLFNEGRLSFKGNRPYEKHYLNEAADN